MERLSHGCPVSFAPLSERPGGRRPGGRGTERRPSRGEGPRCCGTREEEEAREGEADRLLHLAPRDREYPAYTEFQFARQPRGRCVASVEMCADTLADARASQDALDELRFLAGVSELTRQERLCLQAWLFGWKQQDVSARAAALGAPPREDRERKAWTQQRVSYCLRRALRKCYGASGLTFTQFSRHTVYRKPAPRRDWQKQVCPHCREAFARGLGEGAHCSLGCREASRRKARD